MGGYAGIIELGGAVAEIPFVERMAKFASRHGDGNIQIYGNAEFVVGISTLNQLDSRGPGSKAFASIHDISVVGTIRLDARDELVNRLKHTPFPCSSTDTDIELATKAFMTWGKDCALHINGDFSLVAWDAPKKQVYCFRDSFGIKPLYYALLGHTFLFSNDLAALRTTGMFSDDLNEGAISDFLTFGHNLDETTTTFRHINRVPPGHVLQLDKAASISLQGYSKLKFDQRIRYKKKSEYCEHFRSIFEQAVADRTLENKASFELSGGLDSTSVAATACTVHSENPQFSAQGVTTVYSDINPDDQEAYFAGLVAEEFGIQHNTIQAGTAADFFAFNQTAQPYNWPFAATTRKFAACVKAHSTTLLSGQGSDPFMLASGHKIVDDFRTTPFHRFVFSLAKRAQEKRSMFGLGLGTLINPNKTKSAGINLPAWIKPEAVQAAGSIERWYAKYGKQAKYPKGCHAEYAYDQLHIPLWSHLFENYYHDLLSGISCRHPFFDIRVIQFLFSIPAPLKEDKFLLRNSFNDILPKPILQRPKVIVLSDLVREPFNNYWELNKGSMSFKASQSWIDTVSYRSKVRSYLSNGRGTERAYTFDKQIACPLGLELWKKML